MHDVKLSAQTLNFEFIFHSPRKFTNLTICKYSIIRKINWLDLCTVWRCLPSVTQKWHEWKTQRNRQQHTERSNYVNQFSHLTNPYDMFTPKHKCIVYVQHYLNPFHELQTRLGAALVDLCVFFPDVHPKNTANCRMPILWYIHLLCCSLEKTFAAYRVVNVQQRCRLFVN